MIKDYEGIVTSIRYEMGDVMKDHRIGLVDLCSHGGQYTDARKQAALAYLLMQHAGCQEKAWSQMLEWFGGEEDHWRNIGDLYRHYVIPAIKDHFDLELHFSDDDDSGLATQPSEGSTNSSPQPLSQYD